MPDEGDANDKSREPQRSEKKPVSDKVTGPGIFKKTTAATTEEKAQQKAENIEQSIGILEEFYAHLQAINIENQEKQAQEMELHEYAPKLNRELLASVEKAIAEGPWDKGLLFQTVGDKLKELRAKYESTLVFEDITETKTPTHLADRIAQRTGQTEVYISLYSAEGGAIDKWEKIVRALGHHTITRPIYGTEDDIRALIRAKENKKNEAYITAYIAQADIIKPSEDAPKDRLGHELVLVKERAIKPENITRFMHISGHYIFKGNKLVRQGDMEYMDFI